MNATRVLMIVAGVFLIARLVTKDSAGETLAGRLAGGQPSSLKGTNAVGQVNAEGTVIAGTNSTATQASMPIIEAKGHGTLNSDQLVFANTLSKLTGLNIAVVKGWLHAEEPASSPQAPNGANNWLNIGDTGSGNYGYEDPAWDNPVSAAKATYGWLKGQPIGTGGASPTGYGAPGSGPDSIQAILASAKQSLAAQVRAIQISGWAGGHPGTITYPQLPADVSEFR